MNNGSEASYTSEYTYDDRGNILSRKKYAYTEIDVYPIVFEYDTNGTPVGFSYGNNRYYYLTNQMGDVIGITNINRVPIAYYHYDEWGNLLSIETANEGNATQLAVAEANPLRYRGYYYDAETGYYYLQSRYYDASICRFINADEVTFIVDSVDKQKENVYLYCANDPLNNSDPMGFSSSNIFFAGFGVQIEIGIHRGRLVYPGHHLLIRC